MRIYVESASISSILKSSTTKICKPKVTKTY